VPARRGRNTLSTVSFEGLASLGLQGSNTLTPTVPGEEAGRPAFGEVRSYSFYTSAASPGIEAGGGYSGIVTAVTGAGTLLSLANSSNIVISGGTGTVKPAQGYVITGVKRLRGLYLRNLDAGATVTVSIPAANGLAGLGWAAAAVVVVLQPDSPWCALFRSGSAVLTAGSNDGLVLVSSAGAPEVHIQALFG
jgi:hypothetical protein